MFDYRYISDIAYNLIDQYELDWGTGNAYLDATHQSGFIVVEAPHHSTIAVNVSEPIIYMVERKLNDTPENRKFLSGKIKQALIEDMQAFSVEDELECYAEDPSTITCEHSNDSELRKFLVEDKDFFQEIAYRMKEEIKEIPDLEDAN